MLGTVLYGPRDVRFEERDVPTITKPTDAIIRISATCVCGSDLWPYRGIQPVAQPTPMGHEYPLSPSSLASSSSVRFSRPTTLARTVRLDTSRHASTPNLSVLRRRRCFVCRSRTAHWLPPRLFPQTISFPAC